MLVFCVGEEFALSGVSGGLVFCVGGEFAVSGVSGRAGFLCGWGICIDRGLRGCEFSVCVENLYWAGSPGVLVFCVGG